MSGFFMVVVLLFIPILWSKISSLQRQVDDLKTEVERLQNSSPGVGNSFTMNNASSVQHAAPFSTPVDVDPLKAISNINAMNSIDHISQNRDLDLELMDMVRRGNKIQAIKRLREARSLTLKEAKDYVDALDR
ncbi:ribosomal protein L7/L12 [Paenibacillus barcinonensis]|uniref:Ribosomal protein L7/L12 n=2 Tax=Paenibacillus barcinonensis TaxID=198119 RepID=A0ABX6PZL7_PAEBA|nr:ribosomal protein L7/L12 [Paenibacillus barcinonensis]QKS55327.1 ribosomal protein L7/L12 [Paenibacillus barcinonensis]